MKSKHLLLTLLMALLVPWAVNAQETVTIGDGTSAGYYAPIGTYYNYSITEQLYTAEEIGMAGTINSISFYWAYTTAKDFNIDVYMDNVDAANLSTGISLAGKPQVFSGTLSVPAEAGWVTINLTTPFEYDGESNLLIGVNKTGGATWFSGSTWRYTSVSNMTRYSQTDNSAYTTSTTPGSTTPNRPNIQIEITPAGGGDMTCDKPETLTAVQPDVNPNHGVLLLWEGGSGIYNVQMKKNTETNDEWQTKASDFSDNALLINGLDSETTYNLRVQSVCYDNEGGEIGDLPDREETTSGWKTVNYTTPIACPVPTQVTVSDITPYSAVVSWTSEAESFNLKLGETVIERCTSPYTLSNLTPETSYTVKVQAVCSDIDQSQWTSGTSFMTAEVCPEGMVCIGTGTATSNEMPANNYYKYSLTEQIYTAAEIGETGAILSIDFYKASTNNMNSVLDIYIVSTNKTEFESNTDWIQVTASDLVYSGTVTFADNAWTTIELDSPFIYDGVSNICIVVDNNTGSYASNTPFRIFSATNNQSIYYRSDSSNLDPTTAISQSATGKTAQKNRIRLNIGEPPACPKPTGVTASDVTAHEATISWTSDASAWQIQLGEGTAIDVTEPTYTFDRLDSETTYAVKVRANCGGVYSDWANGSFTTAIACTVPTGVAVSNITGHGATITWAEVEGAWYQCAIAKTAEYNVDNIEWSESFEENTLTLNGLDPQTGYTFVLRKDCTDAEDGYSQIVTKTFTTTVACPAPTVAVSNITAFTAEVSCTNTDATEFNVQLINPNVTPADTTTFANVEMPYTLTDLTANTSYKVRVQALCGGEDGESAYSNGTTFMTAEICPEGMVCIGTGTATNSSLPANNYYNYSLTEQIYTAAEIGMAGQISSIEFYKASTTAMAKDLVIYMVNTTKDEFTSTSDWIPVTAGDIVYQGTVTFVDNDWTNIELQNPFNYDGTSNLCIVVDNNTGDYVSSTNFRVFTAAKNQALYYQSDGTNLDPTTSITTTGTRSTSKNRIRIAIGEPPACPKPTGLAVNYTGGLTATVTWEGDATSYNIDVNGTVTEGVTSPYTLEGLELATTYAVMVQANCGEDLSEWTSAVSFTTDLCLPENQCEITFALTDSYGDGWNGAYIEVVDVATGASLDQLSNNNIAKGEETETYTLAVCDGRAIQFVWHSGSYDDECSYVVTDLNGEEIFSGSNAMSAPINYTVNCTVITCKKPKDLAAFDIDKTSVVLSWTPGSEDQNAWRLCYNDGEDHFKNVTEIPYTLNGLTPETQYTVKVRANCGDGDYSDWSDVISFTTAEACPAVIDNFSATNITVHNALLSWTGEYESYQVRYKKFSGETEWSEAISTNEAAIALSGLEAGTQYDYQVQGYCADVDAYTDWVDGIQFETQSICGAPQNLYAVPGIDNATISWTGYQESYMVTFGEISETVVGTTYTITGLESSTEYTVTVIGLGDCGEYESAEIEFTTGAGWNDPTIWADPENPETINPNTVVVIEPGDDPTVIPENITVGDGSYIVIEPGAEVIYEGEDPIPVVITFDDDDDDDGIGPRCRENELPGGYKLLAPPVYTSATQQYVTVESAHLMDMPDDFYNYDLYSFDMHYPAEEWRNYKADQDNFNLNWKQGYLYYGKAYSQITWTGLAVANTNNSVEIDLDYNEANTYFPGANLIGNPFTNKGYPNMEFYVLNSDGNEVISATNDYVKAARGFFVLATEPGQTCTVYTEAPVTLQSLNIALSQDCSLIDAAAIRFNDTKGLAKIQLNPNHTKIYMPFEGKDYAILQGEGLGEMPINIEVEENGTYTLNFASKEVSFSYLHLIDNLTGVETNLLANSNYSFEAKTTDYASRFRLVYATGSSVDGDSFGFINSMGNLSIYGIEGVATLQVMDITGRILSSETFSGSYERKLNVAPGVYMLRLVNGNDVKVQKIVVK